MKQWKCNKLILTFPCCMWIGLTGKPYSTRDLTSCKKKNTFIQYTSFNFNYILEKYNIFFHRQISCCYDFFFLQVWVCDTISQMNAWSCIIFQKFCLSIHNSWCKGLLFPILFSNSKNGYLGLEVNVICLLNLILYVSWSYFFHDMYVSVKSIKCPLNS